MARPVQESNADLHDKIREAARLLLRQRGQATGQDIADAAGLSAAQERALEPALQTLDFQRFTTMADGDEMASSFWDNNEPELWEVVYRLRRDESGKTPPAWAQYVVRRARTDAGALTDEAPRLEWRCYACQAHAEKFGELRHKDLCFHGPLQVRVSALPRLEELLADYNKKAVRLKVGGGLKFRKIREFAVPTHVFVGKATLTDPFGDQCPIPRCSASSRPAHWFDELYVEVQLDGEVPKLPGWTILGRIEATPAGNMVIEAPGQKVPERYRTAESRCEHCNLKRNRNDTIVLQKGAEIKQVGRSCLADFVGSTDAEEMVRTFLAFVAKWKEILENAKGGDDRLPQYDGMSLRDLLTFTAASVRKRGFVSKARALYDARGATSQDVYQTYLTVKIRKETDKDPRTEADAATATAAGLWIAENLTVEGAASNFDHNLAVLARLGWIPKGKEAIGVNMFEKWRVALGLFDPEEVVLDEYRPEAIGEQVTIRATVTQHRERAHSGEHSFSDLYKLRDESGRTLTLFTPSADQSDSGRRVVDDGRPGPGAKVIVRVKIKKKQLYKDKPETQVSKVGEWALDIGQDLDAPAAEQKERRAEERRQRKEALGDQPAAARLKRLAPLERVETVRDVLVDAWRRAVKLPWQKDPKNPKALEAAHAWSELRDYQRRYQREGEAWSAVLVSLGRGKLTFTSPADVQDQALAYLRMSDDRRTDAAEDPLGATTTSREQAEVLLNANDLGFDTDRAAISWASRYDGERDQGLLEVMRGFHALVGGFAPGKTGKSVLDPPQKPVKVKRAVVDASDSAGASSKPVPKKTTTQDATVGEILLAAYKRARWLPWGQTPSERQPVDGLERDAWVAELIVGHDLDLGIEHTYKNDRDALNFLSADDATREKVRRDTEFVSYNLPVKRADLVLAAHEAGFQVSDTRVSEARDLLARALKPGTVIKPTPTLVTQMQRFKAIVGKAKPKPKPRDVSAPEMTLEAFATKHGLVTRLAVERVLYDAKQEGVTREEATRRVEVLRRRRDETYQAYREAASGGLLRIPPAENLDERAASDDPEISGPARKRMRDEEETSLQALFKPGEVTPPIVPMVLRMDEAVTAAFFAGREKDDGLRRVKRYLTLVGGLPLPMSMTEHKLRQTFDSLQAEGKIIKVNGGSGFITKSLRKAEALADVMDRALARDNAEAPAGKAPSPAKSKAAAKAREVLKTAPGRKGMPKKPAASRVLDRDKRGRGGRRAAEQATTAKQRAQGEKDRKKAAEQAQQHAADKAKRTAPLESITLLDQQVRVLASLIETWTHGSAGGWGRKGRPTAVALEARGLVAMLDAQDDDEALEVGIEARGMAWLDMHRSMLTAAEVRMLDRTLATRGLDGLPVTAKAAAKRRAREVLAASPKGRRGVKPAAKGTRSGPKLPASRVAERDRKAGARGKARRQQPKPEAGRPTMTFSRPVKASELDPINRQIGEGTIGLADYKAGFAALMESKTELLAEWQKRTKEKLAPGASKEALARYTKPELVKKVWNAMLNIFMIQPGDDEDVMVLITEVGARHKTFEQRVIDFVGGMTASKLAALNEQQITYNEKQAADEAKLAARLAAPETLADFSALSRRRKLTDKERLQVEQLQAEASLNAAAARRGPREITVPVSDRGWHIVPTWHFRQNVQTWTVRKETVGKDIERDEFVRLNNAAKALSGKWESFRKTEGDKKALNGFLFFNEASARRFLDVLKGETVTNAEETERRRQRAEEGRADNLAEMADRTRAGAEEVLGQDRKTNTMKRAREAAGVEGQARTALGLADSIERIGAAIADGSAKFLRGVGHRSQVETLDSILRRAQWAMVERVNKDLRNGQDHLGRQVGDGTKGLLLSPETHARYKEMRHAGSMPPPAMEDVDAVVYPWPHFSANVLGGIARDVAKKAGCKRISARVTKMIASYKAESFTIDTHAEIELLRELAKCASKSRLVGDLEEYNRVQAMGLTNLAMLKAALREYLGCCKGTAPKEDPIKAQERALVGRQYPGYFPTPRTLADEVVERANLKDGMRVLEPSAGKGNLAEAIIRAAPGVELEVFEMQYDLREVLKAKGFTIIGHDFMTATEDGPGAGTYDRIIANPPFEENVDIEHVMHAYSLLRPGGRLVSIMGNGSLTNSNKKVTAFRKWLSDHGGTHEPNEEGAFLSSERPTGVASQTVVIDKPAIQTRGALAAARGGDGAYLSHSVTVDADGREQKVLCGRIKLDNLADSYAPIDHDSRPSCPACLAADPRFKGTAGKSPKKARAAERAREVIAAGVKPGTRAKPAATRVLDRDKKGRGGRRSVEQAAAAQRRATPAPTKAAGRPDYHERKEGRIDRLDAGAGKAADESSRRFDASRRQLEHHTGEPIKVGHHSEGRHRRDIERAHGHMRAGIEAEGRAAELGGRADAARNNTAISSDDPEAISALEIRLERAIAKHQDSKNINEALRSKDPHAALDAIGYKGATIQELIDAGKIDLTNSNARIKATKERIADLKQREQSAAPDPVSRGAFTARWDSEINRVVVEVPEADKAERQRRAAIMGSSGFRWAGTHYQQAASDTAWHKAIAALTELAPNAVTIYSAARQEEMRQQDARLALARREREPYRRGEDGEYTAHVEHARVSLYLPGGRGGAPPKLGKRQDAALRKAGFAIKYLQWRAENTDEKWEIACALVDAFADGGAADRVEAAASGKMKVVAKIVDGMLQRADERKAAGDAKAARGEATEFERGDYRAVFHVSPSKTPGVAIYAKLLPAGAARKARERAMKRADFAWSNLRRRWEPLRKKWAGSRDTEKWSAAIGLVNDLSGGARADDADVMDANDKKLRRRLAAKAAPTKTREKSRGKLTTRLSRRIEASTMKTEPKIEAKAKAKAKAKAIVSGEATIRPRVGKKRSTKRATDRAKKPLVKGEMLSSQGMVLGAFATPTTTAEAIRDIVDYLKRAAPAYAKTAQVEGWVTTTIAELRFQRSLTMVSNRKSDGHVRGSDIFKVSPTMEQASAMAKRNAKTMATVAARSKVEEDARIKRRAIALRAARWGGEQEWPAQKAGRGVVVGARVVIREHGEGVVSHINEARGRMIVETDDGAREFWPLREATLIKYGAKPGAKPGKKRVVERQNKKAAERRKKTGPARRGAVKEATRATQSAELARFVQDSAANNPPVFPAGKPRRGVEVGARVALMDEENVGLGPDNAAMHGIVEKIDRNNGRAYVLADDRTRVYWPLSEMDTEANVVDAKARARALMEPLLARAGTNADAVTRRLAETRGVDAWNLQHQPSQDALPLAPTEQPEVRKAVEAVEAAKKAKKALEREVKLKPPKTPAAKKAVKVKTKKVAAKLSAAQRELAAKTKRAEARLSQRRCALQVAEKSARRGVEKAEKEAARLTVRHAAVLAKLEEKRSTCKKGCKHSSKRLKAAECRLLPTLRDLAQKLQDANAQRQRELVRHVAAVAGLAEMKVAVSPLVAPTEKRVDGAPPKRKGCGTVCHIDLLGGLCGGQAAVMVPGRGTAAPFAIATRYCAIEADKIISSHDPITFEPDPRYPEGVQERRYDRDKMEQAKVLAIAKTPRPEIIINTSASPLDGTPIVTMTGIVLGGNGRSMGWRRANAQGDTTFTDYVLRNAAEFGFKAAQLRKFKNPMIVRVIDPPREEWSRYVRDLNQGLTQVMDQIAEAVSLARQMPSAALDVLAEGLGDGTMDEFFKSNASKPFVRAMETGGLVTMQNRARMIHPSGLLSEEGRALAVRQLSAAVLPHADVLEFAGAEVRLALARSAPYWLAAAAHGGDWDLRHPLELAMRDLIKAKAEQDGQPGKFSLLRFFRQVDLFNPPQTKGHAFGLRMLVLLTHLADKPAVFAKLAKEFAADAQMFSGGQRTFLAPKTALESLEECAGRVKIDKKPIDLAAEVSALP